jgi:hypothetical protein
VHDGVVLSQVPSPDVVPDELEKTALLLLLRAATTP